METLNEAARQKRTEHAAYVRKWRAANPDKARAAYARRKAVLAATENDRSLAARCLELAAHIIAAGGRIPAKDRPKCLATLAAAVTAAGALKGNQCPPVSDRQAGAAA